MTKKEKNEKKRERRKLQKIETRKERKKRWRRDDFLYQKKEESNPSGSLLHSVRSVDFGEGSSYSQIFLIRNTGTILISVL